MPGTKPRIPTSRKTAAMAAAAFCRVVGVIEVDRAGVDMGTPGDRGAHRARCGGTYPRARGARTRRTCAPSLAQRPRPVHELPDQLGDLSAVGPGDHVGTAGQGGVLPTGR